MMPLVQKRFWFLVHEKACSTKKSFWSSDPHQAIFLTYFTDILSGIHIWSHIFSDILSGSGILSGISILGDSSWLRSGGEHFDTEVAVGVRRGTLWSGACGGGPVGNTLVRSLAVEVRRGTLWSRGCCWGPAGNTLILSLLFGSGGENCDLELAVEVRRGSLWSWACCSGPVGKTAI